MQDSDRCKGTKWMILFLVVAGLFLLYVPAKLSQDHLELQHKKWNGG